MRILIATLFGFIMKTMNVDKIRKERRYKEANLKSSFSVNVRLNFPWPGGEVWLPSHYPKFVNCCVNSEIPSESTTKCWNGLRTIKNNYNLHLSCILVITSTYRKLDGLVQITIEQNTVGDCSSPGRRMVNLSQVAAPRCLDTSGLVPELPSWMVYYRVFSENKKWMKCSLVLVFPAGP